MLYSVIKKLETTGKLEKGRIYTDENGYQYSVDINNRLENIYSNSNNTRDEIIRLGKHSGSITIQNEGTTLPLQSIIDFQGTGVNASDGGTKTIITVPTPQSYSTIENSGTPLTQRSIINFTGAGVTASDVGGITQVNIPSTQGYATIQDEGTPLAQQTVIDFQGTGVTASNGTGKTIVTVPIQPAYTTVQDEGSALTQTNIINFVGSGVTATNGSGKTTITIPGTPAATAYGVYAETTNSTAVTATVSELTIIGTGVGTLSVPANGFTVGDSFVVEMGGDLSAKNGNTLQIKVKGNSVILGDTGAQTMTTSVNDVWYLSLTFTIRQIGAAGTASIVTLGLFNTVKHANGAPISFAFNTLNNTTFDTTISNTLDITAQWSTNSSANSISSATFVLTKVY